MATTTERAVKLLKDRLAELDGERLRLERALRELAGPPTKQRQAESDRLVRSRSNRRNQRRGVRGRARQTRESRLNQLEALVRSDPEASNAVLAAKLGVSRPYVSVLLGELRAQQRLPH